MLDSLTRLGRAFNRSASTPTPGARCRAASTQGARDPKQIFGVARNTEEGGSLTMIATCLVDTGSQGDQVIFEEFKGTGNMELILDRSVAEKRLFPAINLAGVGHAQGAPAAGRDDAGDDHRPAPADAEHAPDQQVEQLLAATEQRFPTNAELVGD
jgi:transcription termination factor Rho